MHPFNPTMVRLQLLDEYRGVGEGCSFNPTMVRLQLVIL